MKNQNRFSKDKQKANKKERKGIRDHSRNKMSKLRGLVSFELFQSYTT